MYVDDTKRSSKSCAWMLLSLSIGTEVVRCEGEKLRPEMASFSQ